MHSVQRGERAKLQQMAVLKVSGQRSWQPPDVAPHKRDALGGFRAPGDGSAVQPARETRGGGERLGRPTFLQVRANTSKYGGLPGCDYLHSCA